MSLPLEGIRVVEFTHMVMGPTCGMVLGDLGAEVIKVEPPDGDKTRKLGGVGAGFFRTFNRNKKSLALDLDQPEARAMVAKLLSTADVVSENFRPGRMASLGFDYATLSASNPRLIYASHKGFLPGPYENRTALDEVVQMMAGLAYMTGPAGRPLRAGTSVNDIMGGIFGAVAVLAALRERDRTGKGQEVQSALYENCVFLSAQHMQQYAVSGVEPTPLPERKQAAWGIYDIYTVANGEQVFIAVTGDSLYKVFCKCLELDELGSDPRLQTNGDRVKERAWFKPRLAELLKDRDAQELERVLEANGIPYARIVRPHELFEDRHLNESGGLGELQADDGQMTRVPLLPFALSGKRLGARMPLPKIGEQTREILRGIGYTEEQLDAVLKEETSS
jgi:crotonobetainyl-CoA:carnitine CoA-transferase CaiB-like acyl-CoA transferase